MTLSDRERERLALHTVGRLDERARKELAKRVLLILYRQGRATVAHLRAAGISQADIDAAIHDR